MIPAAMSCSSESWRCEVDGGWTTIVWTLPSEAVSSGSVNESMHRATGVPATLDLERQHPAGDAVAELADGDVVLGVARQAGVQDAAHAVLTLEPRGECRRGLRMALHPDGQRQDAAQDQERIERADRRPGVVLDALHLRDEIPPASHHAGDDVAVPAQELGRRLDDEVRAKLERPADVRRGERVVDDVRRPVLVGDARHRGVVGNYGGRVRDGLGVHDAGRSVGDGRCGRSVVGHVHEIDADAEPRERARQQVARRPIGGLRRDDSVARAQLGREGRVDRAHARRQRRPGLATGELGVGIAERAAGRVGEARVGVAGVPVGNDIAQLFGVGRGERRRLVDRDARRPLVDARAVGGRSDGPRREALRGRVAHGRMLHRHDPGAVHQTFVALLQMGSARLHRQDRTDRGGGSRVGEAFFSDVEGRVPFGGLDASDPLSFKVYEPDRLVLGKRMEDHLRIGRLLLALVRLAGHGHVRLRARSIGRG